MAARREPLYFLSENFRPVPGIRWLCPPTKRDSSTRLCGNGYRPGGTSAHAAPSPPRFQQGHETLRRSRALRPLVDGQIHRKRRDYYIEWEEFPTQEMIRAVCSTKETAAKARTEMVSEIDWAYIPFKG